MTNSFLACRSNWQISFCQFRDDTDNELGPFSQTYKLMIYEWPVSSSDLALGYGGKIFNENCHTHLVMYRQILHILSLSKQYLHYLLVSIVSTSKFAIHLLFPLIKLISALHHYWWWLISSQYQRTIFWARGYFHSWLKLSRWLSSSNLNNFVVKHWRKLGSNGWSSPAIFTYFAIFLCTSNVRFGLRCIKAQQTEVRC